MRSTRASSPLVMAAPTYGDSEPELFRALKLSAATVLMTGLGAVDAAGVKQLAERIDRNLRGYRQLVLDLSRIEHVSPEGYALLDHVNIRCARTGVDWVLVPGPAVDRLLHLCDPAAAIPIAPNIVSAVATLARNHTGRLLG